MLGAPAVGFGGYASPEGLADAHGMGYGDNNAGAQIGGANYSALTRALINAYSRFYGGNSSLLGHNRSVFGGPMMTSGPTDVQGAMIGSNVPTDANPSGFIGSGIGLDHTFPAVGHVNSIPTPAFVDLTDPNLQDPMGGGVGATPAGAYSFGGTTSGVPTSANIDGGSDPYIRRKHRLPGFAPDYGAYVDLYEDLVAAQPQGMSKADWGRRHWERHGGQEGRSFYGPSERVLPPRPDGTIGMEFITRPQLPPFNSGRKTMPTAYKPPTLAYENAYNMWQGGDQP